jgi:hypothetical protein
MSQEQLDLFESNNMKVDSFFICEADDETRFPVIGFQNFDEHGKPYMDDVGFKLFAGDLLGLLIRSCSDKKFDIEWAAA